MVDNLTFEKAIRPLSRITRCLGLAFFISKRTSRTVHIQIFLTTFISFALIILFAYIATSVYINQHDLNAAVQMSDVICVVLCSGSAIFSYITSMFYHAEKTEAISEIIQVDNILQREGNMNLNIEYQKIRNFLKKGLVVYFLHCILVFVFDFLAFGMTTINLRDCIVYCYYTVTTITLVQFLLLTYTIKRRFRLINQILKSSITQYISTVKNLRRYDNNYDLFYKMQIDNSAQKLFKTLVLVQKCHAILFKTVRLINKCYTVDNLFNILRSGAISITLIFIMCNYIITRKSIFINDMTVSYYIYFVIGIGTSFGIIYHLGTFCSNIQREALQTGIILFNQQTMEFPKCIEYADSIKFLIEFISTRLLHENFTFTACNLLNIDKNLIIGAAGAVGTYMVVILQFQIMDTFKGESKINTNFYE